MKYVFILPLLFLWVFALMFSNATKVIRVQNNVRAYVYAVCEDAHLKVDGVGEQACGDAQDKTNTEFLCTNPSEQAACWVEIK